MFFAFSLLALLVAFLAVSSIGDESESRVAEPDWRSLMERSPARIAEAQPDLMADARDEPSKSIRDIA